MIFCIDRDNTMCYNSVTLHKGDTVPIKQFSYTQNGEWCK